MFKKRRVPTLALAGAGSIAAVHALAAAEAGLRVAAVASAGGRKARHLAGQVDARKVRIQDLPCGADVMVVATPPGSHAELALQGLAAGAKVLVEKPLAATLDQADRLVAASSAEDVVLRCAENLLFAPAWQAVRARKDRLGPLRHLSARTVQPPPDWGHFREPLTSGGVLFDLGPHALALVMELAGSEPTAVAATLSSTRTDGADDQATASIRFRDGLVATVEVAWTASDAHWALQAAGESGVLRMELFPEITAEADGQSLELPEPRSHGPLAALERLGYVDQLRDIATGGSQGQTPQQAREVLEVICAAYTSASRGGEEVALPFDGDRKSSPLQLWRS